MEDMKTLSNSILLEKLNKGEVKCKKCDGYYKPFNPKFDVNHYFVCKKCGDSVHVDPIVVVEQCANENWLKIN